MISIKQHVITILETGDKELEKGHFFRAPTLLNTLQSPLLALLHWILTKAGLDKETGVLKGYAICVHLAW